MRQDFIKMMREQVQETINNPLMLLSQPRPKTGWIKVIRQILGMSSYQLAKRMGCTQANVTALEKREQKESITLEKLSQAAKALNCRCVYFFVPDKPFDQLLEDQAHLVTKKHLRFVGHSMELEQQGLLPQQKKQQEKSLAQELVQNNLKKLWNDR